MASLKHGCSSHWSYSIEKRVKSICSALSNIETFAQL